jgi:hypothetical protein
MVIPMVSIYVGSKLQITQWYMSMLSMADTSYQHMSDDCYYRAGTGGIYDGASCLRRFKLSLLKFKGA